jgi:hypothetical protein
MSEPVHQPREFSDFSDYPQNGFGRTDEDWSEWAAKMYGRDEPELDPMDDWDEDMPENSPDAQI